MLSRSVIDRTMEIKYITAWLRLASHHLPDKHLCLFQTAYIVLLLIVLLLGTISLWVLWVFVWNSTVMVPDRCSFTHIWASYTEVWAVLASCKHYLVIIIRRHVYVSLSLVNETESPI